MPDEPADPILEALVNDFGANYVFAVDLLEEYRRDRSAVDPTWGTYFDKLLGVAAPATPSAPAAQEAPAEPEAPAQPAPEPRGTTTLVRTAPAPAARNSRALAVPSILPGDIATPIRGGAMRIVENMEASLQVPTATSLRNVPVRTLEENRAILNKHRAATAASKVSFTAGSSLDQILLDAFDGNVIVHTSTGSPAWDFNKPTVVLVHGIYNGFAESYRTGRQYKEQFGDDINVVSFFWGFEYGV